MYRSLRARRLFALALALLAIGACDKISKPQPARPSPAFAITVLTRQSGQQPLAGVKIIQNRKEIGTSDAQGVIKLKLKGAEGSSVSLTVKCPEGYASPEKPIVFGLRHMAKGSPAPKFEAQCIPTSRTIVVGIRAENGPNLPIVRLNRTVGRTDAFGVAHILIQAAPEEQVSFTLNTSSNTSLKPPNPSLTFVARDRDEMVLLDQKFTVVKPVVKRAKPKVPQRL